MAPIPEDVRQRVRVIERGGATDAAAPPMLGLGDESLGGYLPRGGLECGALHEMRGDEGPATGFVALLAGRLAGPVLWVVPLRRLGGLYGPGLAALGLAAESLLLAGARGDGDLLWAMEEGLRAGGLAAVIGEPTRIGTIAARRLQLAAEAGGTTAFLLRPDVHAPGAPAATPTRSRWRVEAAPSGPAPPALPGTPRWHLALERCRGGTPGRWLVAPTKGGGLETLPAAPTEPRHRAG